MLRKAFASLLAGLFLAGAAYAGEFWTPEKNSPERKEIMDAARVPIEEDIRQPVIFVVEHLRRNRDWAFLHAVPKRPDGGDIDYHGTDYQADIDEGVFGGTAAVLLKRKGSGWSVVTWGLGFSDVIWDNWDEEFGAPEGLWP